MPEIIYVFSFSYMILNEVSPVLGEALLQNPSLVLKQFDKAAKNALRDKCTELQSNQALPGCEILTIKNNIHVRIYSLPAGESILRQEFPSCKDKGVFLCILGTVVKTGSPKLLEFSKPYRCSKCKKTFDVEAPLEKCHAFPKKVNRCPNLCVDGRLTPVQDERSNKRGGDSLSSYKDYQEIKLQVT